MSRRSMAYDEAVIGAKDFKFCKSSSPRCALTGTAHMSRAHLTDTRFDHFGLDERLLSGLAAAGFEYCTPIQAQTLPLALAGQDVAGQAQTGTGKTAAYLVAAFQRLLTAPAPASSVSAPRVLVLAPTRELVVQIHRDAQVLAQHTGIRLGLVFGGTDYRQQRDLIAAGVDLLVGTPGRLIDYHKQKVFSLKAVSVLVLDEADRMFDLGFIKDIRFVLRRLPPPECRLNLLFSATLSYRVTELAYEYMNDPRMVAVAPEQVTADRVRQCCYLVANEEKIPLLVGLLRRFAAGRTMVFVNTKREAERLWRYLHGNGLGAAMLSGDVPQKKRLRLLRQFQSGELPILVATDVAARGLHIPGVTHVINFDLPADAEDYVHRIGRTARAGEAGDAISFVCESHAFCLPDIEAYIGARIPVATFDAELLAGIKPPERARTPRAPRMERGAARRPRAEAPRGETPAADGEPTKKRRRRRKPTADAHGEPA